MNPGDESEKTKSAVAKRYQTTKQKIRLFSLLLTPLALGVLFLTPLSSLYKENLLLITQSRYGVLALYFVGLSLFMLIFDLPLAYYSGFVLEHQYGLSNHTFVGWARDQLKAGLLSFGISFLLILALYALIWNQPAWWWLYAWAGYSVFSYVLGKIFPIVILPLFYKYGNVENDEVCQKIRQLATTYKMPVDKIYSLNLSKTTKKANAAFMGLGKTKRVVLSDTLLQNFTAEEIETVVAHELGHYHYKHIIKQLVIGLGVSLALFALAGQVITPIATRFDFQGSADIAAMPILFILAYLFGMVFLPFQNAISRWMERQADRFAFRALGGSESFISCMKKLAELNLADPSPHPVYEWIFYDHPAINRRIEMAKGYKANV